MSPSAFQRLLRNTKKVNDKALNTENQGTFYRKNGEISFLLCQKKRQKNKHKKGTLTSWSQMKNSGEKEKQRLAMTKQEMSI